MLPRAAFYPPPDSLDPHPFFPHGIGQLTMFAGEFSFAVNNFRQIYSPFSGRLSREALNETS